MPPPFTPPLALMPSYMTSFQSSPVKIYRKIKSRFKRIIIQIGGIFKTTTKRIKREWKTANVKCKTRKMNRWSESVFNGIGKKRVKMPNKKGKIENRDQWRQWWPKGGSNTARLKKEWRKGEMTQTKWLTLMKMTSGVYDDANVSPVSWQSRESRRRIDGKEEQVT